MTSHCKKLLMKGREVEIKFSKLSVVKTQILINHVKGKLKLFFSHFRKKLFLNKIIFLSGDKDCEGKKCRKNCYRCVSGQ